MTTIENIAVSEGVSRFIAAARQNGLRPELTNAKAGDEAITMVYARPSEWNGKAVTGYRTYFLVFHRAINERIDDDVLKCVIGTKNKDRAMKRGRIEIASEMEPNYMGPFVSDRFSSDLRIIVNKSSYDLGTPVNFSTGVPLDKGGGYFLMLMKGVYTVLGMLHPEKVSLKQMVR